jgi:ABC-type phosphate/phosphonate transport system substrate-binding protein
VVPFKTYEALQQGLLAGEVDAAWGPPLICARIEAAGGMVALRAVRRGAVTYRSVLLSRKLDTFDVASLTASTFRPRAVWVDTWSMAGYLLPRAHLRRAGVDLAEALLSEKLLGSYTACFDAVLNFEAELTASFIGETALDALWGDRGRRLRPIAYTDEIPNDGVVLAPSLPPDRRVALADNLRTLLAGERGHRVLCSVFTATAFDRPVANTYARILDLV